MGVVKISNVGKIYSTYQDTFRYFQIQHECHGHDEYDFYYRLNDPVNVKNRTYIIVNCVQHSDYDILLYHLRAIDGKRESVVISEDGIISFEYLNYMPFKTLIETEVFVNVEKLE